MRIHVRLFAVLRDSAGRGELEIELPAGAVATDVRDRLAAVVPSLAPFLPRVALAVNRSYADPQTALSDGDEVALIPPVSGG